MTTNYRTVICSSQIWSVHIFHQWSSTFPFKTHSIYLLPYINMISFIRERNNLWKLMFLNIIKKKKHNNMKHYKKWCRWLDCMLNLTFPSLAFLDQMFCVEEIKGPAEPSSSSLPSLTCSSRAKGQRYFIHLEDWVWVADCLTFVNEMCPLCPKTQIIPESQCVSVSFFTDPLYAPQLGHYTVMLNKKLSLLGPKH